VPLSVRARAFDAACHRALHPGGTHYKFPPVALSSITARVTGCVLSGGARARRAAPQGR
jgi:hypothetical protein